LLAVAITRDPPFGISWGTASWSLTWRQTGRSVCASGRWQAGSRRGRVPAGTPGSVVPVFYSGSYEVQLWV